MMIYNIIFILLAVSTTTVKSHGFMLYPLARQYRCYAAQDFYWPDDGSNIKNPACKLAFQHVYQKSGAAAAQYMFVQYSEYAALAGSNYNDMEHIQHDVVPKLLCSAAADNASTPYGDKSGISLPSHHWQTTTLIKRGLTQLYYCPTVPHDPSFFQVFITKNDFDVGGTEITWNDLELLQEQSSVIIPNSKNVPNNEECGAFVYSINVSLPLRHKPFTVFVRWQREDSVGEGFYDCSDVVYNGHTKFEL
jgi:predicted carbohydrate-binding protein with CBM5 and CBM33 domain